ncbi:MAG: hypothetical protein ABI629_02345 [bacterium]
MARAAPNLSDAERSRIEANHNFPVPHIEEACLQRDAALVERRAARHASDGAVTLTITACKRPPLFIRTLQSFLNACTDREPIGRWMRVDDNSRGAMMRKRPAVGWSTVGKLRKPHGRKLRNAGSHVHRCGHQVNAAINRARIQLAGCLHSRPAGGWNH